MADVRDLKGLLFGLHARTSLHPGAGQAVGTVDLPIKRERHTNWPMIQGSAVKGVLRDVCREHLAHGTYGGDRLKANSDSDLEAVFGPATIQAGDDTAWAGALIVTDARVLAFPVRSLKGVFAWVTCPLALQRLKDDAAITGRALTFDVVAPAADTAFAGPEIRIVTGTSTALVVEELSFDVRDQGTALSAAANAIACLASPAMAVPPSDRKDAVMKRLAIVTDDDFTYLVEYATEVSARIALDYRTKTVSGGALFYQECLPPEALLYSVLLTDSSRSSRGGTVKTSDDVRKFICNCLPKYLQIGGDETTGKGICATRLWPDQGGME
ncbi:MAG: type III-B CRISPR module RAMP protein Cmr4 [Phycisphaerales bacterium]|nr:type III-B CRISPR module RAMP protein Cmr4 [Phycisphaerales bacterium]